MADLHDDDRLIDALAVALRPEVASEPSMSELAAFQAVVRNGGAGAVRARSGRLRRWAAGLLVGGVVLSGGTAYATNSVAPRPVRSAAFALKLPVESPELTDAKDALADLEEELREGPRDKVAAEVEDVREELADLSPEARRALEPRSVPLLATAAAYLTASVDDGRGDDRRRDRAGSSGPGSDDDDRVDDSGGDDAVDDSGSGSSSGSGSARGSGSGEHDTSVTVDSSGSGSGDEVVDD